MKKRNRNRLGGVYAASIDPSHGLQPVPALAPDPDDLWRHRSESMRCQTCIFFVLKAGTLGRCRRHAPTLAGWPAVFKRDWCGDHKLDGNKL